MWCLLLRRGKSTTLGLSLAGRFRFFVGRVFAARGENTTDEESKTTGKRKS